MKRVRATVGVLIALVLSMPISAPVAAGAEDGQCTRTTDAAKSVARLWDEVALDAIRRDFPAPTVHARNLYHLSAAM